MKSIVGGTRLRRVGRLAAVDGWPAKRTTQGRTHVLVNTEVFSDKNDKERKRSDTSGAGRREIRIGGFRRENSSGR